MKDDSKLITLHIIGEEEKKALLTAFKMCRGDWPWAFEGWKIESHQIWLEKLIDAAKDIQLKYVYAWHPMQDDRVLKGEFVFVGGLKPFLVDALTMYIGGFPDEYKGAEIWRREIFLLIRRLALS